MKNNRIYPSKCKKARIGKVNLYLDKRYEIVGVIMIEVVDYNQVENGVENYPIS